MTRQDKIDALLKEQDIADNYKPFDVAVSLKADYPTRNPSYNLIFPNVLEKLSKGQVASFLKTFPPHDELLLTTDYSAQEYKFRYKWSVSQSPNSGPDLKVNYISTYGDEIMLSVNPGWLGEYLIGYFTKVNDTELHYFGGVSRNKIGRIGRTKFKAEQLSYYGDSHTLTCAHTANKMIEDLMTNEV